MFGEKIYIDNINSWKNIYENCSLLLDAYPEYNFICFEQNNKTKEFKLLGDDDLEMIDKDKSYNCDCYILPYSAFFDLNYSINYNFEGFDQYRKYYIIKKIYQYKNNKELYYMIWFTNVLYQISRVDFDRYFNFFKNYDINTIQPYVSKLLSICRKQLKEYDIELELVYRQTRKYFSPIAEIDFLKFEEMFQCADISDLNIFLNYICFLINYIKESFRFVVVYRKRDDDYIREMKYNIVEKYVKDLYRR